MLDRNLSSVFHLISRRSPRGGYSWLSLIDWEAGSERLITIPKHRQGRGAEQSCQLRAGCPQSPGHDPLPLCSLIPGNWKHEVNGEADLAGWLECFGSQQMCRGPKTDLSITSGNEVLTFSPHSNRQCEGTGASASAGRSSFLLIPPPGAVFRSCSLCPAFLWCFVPGAWEGSTWQPFQRRAPGSFAEPQRLVRG